jgi:hypothetical protein
MLLSFESWDRLRGLQALDVERARRVLYGAAIAIVRAN